MEPNSNLLNIHSPAASIDADHMINYKNSPNLQKRSFGSDEIWSGRKEQQNNY